MGGKGGKGTLSAGSKALPAPGASGFAPTSAMTGNGAAVSAAVPAVAAAGPKAATPAAVATVAPSAPAAKPAAVVPAPAVAAEQLMDAVQEPLSKPQMLPTEPVNKAVEVSCSVHTV